MGDLFLRKKESYIGIGFFVITVIWTIVLVKLVIKAVAFVYFLISSLL